MVVASSHFFVENRDSARTKCVSWKGNMASSTIESSDSLSVAEQALRQRVAQSAEVDRNAIPPLRPSVFLVKLNCPLI